MRRAVSGRGAQTGATGIALEAGRALLTARPTIASAACTHARAVDARYGVGMPRTVRARGAAAQANAHVGADLVLFVAGVARRAGVILMASAIASPGAPRNCASEIRGGMTVAI